MECDQDGISMEYNLQCLDKEDRQCHMENSVGETSSWCKAVRNGEFKLGAVEKEYMSVKGLILSLIELSYALCR